ncbi:hypothetical protein QTH89_06310 [Variovorax sp. J22G21]|nr:MULTISPECIES: hypothetical protein [unclassified Variovorax]MDM0042215.1 hypothetical protein [Variovorax sp. J22R193]MDM0058125.1 hypothetical protein [Variovorax sp. J22G47]MDM0060819.1 hypothetical protein [Variovorax sp. J22G21]
MTLQTRHRILHAGAWLAAAAALGGVFALYTRPDFLVQMVDQIWACF